MLCDLTYWTVILHLINLAIDSIYFMIMWTADWTGLVPENWCCFLKLGMRTQLKRSCGIKQWGHYSISFSRFERCTEDRQDNRKIGWFLEAKGHEWNSSHLGVNQPAVVERDVKQVEHNAFWGVLEDPHACELDVHIQTRLQLVQHRHGITHVLEEKGRVTPNAKRAEDYSKQIS